MRRGVKVAFGLAAVGVVALLPLFGDPFPGSAVSHAEWARMVLRGLDLLSDEPGHNDTAQQVFAALSGRESRSFGADEYVRATRLEVEGQGNERRVRPSSGVGEAVYAVSIVRAGEYRLRLNVGAPAPPEAELTRAGDTAVLHRFSVPAGREVGWVEAGAVFLDPGAYETSVLLPEGAALQHVEVAPPCLQPIEPRGGWKASAVATTADVAMTVLQALDLESELPPSAAPIEIDGTELRLDNGSRAVTDAAHGFRAGARGARAILLVDVPQSGLYTLSAFGTPTGGHRWLADGCRTCFVCPSTDAVGRWQTILSAHLQKGRHLFTAALGPGSLIERLRLSPKRDEDADYLGTTRRLGLDLGEPGPISRDKAEEARRFIERRRVDALETCSATLRPGAMIADTVVSGAAGGAGGAGGGAGETGGETGGGTGAGGEAGGETGGGGGGGNVPPPIVPPLPPASPTVPTAFSPA